MACSTLYWFLASPLPDFTVGEGEIVCFDQFVYFPHQLWDKHTLARHLTLNILYDIIKVPLGLPPSGPGALFSLEVKLCADVLL